MTSDDLAEKAENSRRRSGCRQRHSLESGPEEFAWIMEPIRENVENTIRIMFKGYLQQYPHCGTG
jgi:hypothetical protein